MARIGGSIVKGLIKTLGVLCLCWPMHSALADTFEVGFYDYPPMMIEDGRRGIYQDILDALAFAQHDRYALSLGIPLAILDGRIGFAGARCDQSITPARQVPQHEPAVFAGYHAENGAWTARVSNRRWGLRGRDFIFT